ncbi:hypothetical protein J6590_019443 [Homalodisca vitripennis]|nr:hypothetical protein J6590_019443 [Homalodisca vitripennis]KAG8264095.1 hypothetical protein J6590_019443 [Homalodisca vitripennis]
MRTCSKMVTIEEVGRPVGLGEGPYWDEESQTLYFIDLFNHEIHNYNPKTKEHHSVNVETEGKPVTLVVKVKNEKNKFVISVKNHLAVVNWDGISSKPLNPEHLADIESSNATTRLNDGKCDPSNRLWAGTMGPLLKGSHDQFEEEKGAFYIIHKNLTVTKQLSKVGISNGLAWSLDKKKMYFIDSLKCRVDSYDYDDASGVISNEKTVFCLKKNNIKGLPDGMTIDAEGMLWVAVYGGACVLRINPNSGELLHTLKIPSLQTTSVAFGGPNLEDLYVTSAKVGFTEEMEKQYPFAGHTFRVTGLGVKGTPSLPMQL